MDYDELSALSQVLDTSFGRSSTKGGVSSFSIKMSVVGESTVKLIYSTIVNLTTDHDAFIMKQRYTDESGNIIDSHVKSIKAQYKEYAGKPLKLKEKASTVTLEMVNMNPHNKKKTALFRRVVMYDV